MATAGGSSCSSCRLGPKPQRAFCGGLWLALGLSFLGATSFTGGSRPFQARQSLRQLARRSRQPQWEALQKEAEAAGEDDKAAWQRRCESAGSLLLLSVLERLHPLAPPATSLDVEPADGGDAALNELLGEHVPLAIDFLSESEQPGAMSKAFWDSEMYLRQIAPEAESSVVEEVQRSSEKALEYAERESPEMQEALGNSLLYARQQYISAIRFGYFVRRAAARLRLEAVMFGADKCRNLNDYVGKLALKDQVELVRSASVEVSVAVEQRATELFGDPRMLLLALERNGAAGLPSLQLSPEGCAKISVEAICLGAALYDAEEEASNFYEMTFTEFGSRSGTIF